MRFLFVFAGPNKIGGIETLIARMSRWLLGQGHEVALVTGEFSECAGLLPQAVRVIELKADYEKLFRRSSALSTWQRTNLPPPEVVKSFDVAGAWAASMLAGSLTPAPRILCGIYNPMFLDSGETLRGLRNRVWEKHFIRHVPAEARLFMANEQLEAVREKYGPSQDGRLFLLPVDAARFERAARSPRWGRIVSIGRLVPWKGYNQYMIGVIAELRARGRDVHWDVYGDGDEAYVRMLQSEIDARGLSDRVRLRGNLPYEAFADALRDAYIFVGMGTSVLEASFCGVPNVVAIANDPHGRTLGPIHRFPPGNTGEPGSRGPYTSVLEALEQLLAMDADEYARECGRVRDYARQYDQERTMQGFVRYAEAAPVGRITSSWLRLLYYFSFLWIGLTRSLAR
jgi:glycosyltransferase involved in cell wall biosynthesis